MKRSLQIALFIFPFLVAGLLLAIFQYTDPAAVGPGSVLGVFILIYLGCLSVLFILLRFGLYWFRKLLALRNGSSGYVSSGIGTRKAYYIASVLAFLPVTFLAMHAYSQLRLIDVVLVVAFMAIATFYVIKRQ